MDQTSRRKLISQIKRDIQQNEAEIVRLRDLLAYVSGEPAPVATPTPRRSRGPSAGPTVKTFIREAFQSPPGQALNVREITEGAYKAGWNTESSEPETIIRTNLRRLIADEEVARDANGQYRYIGIPPNPIRPAPAAPLEDYSDFEEPPF
jgi:hypothetical protein